MYSDLMIDLETLGTKPGAVFTQIGLVAFDVVPDESNSMARKDIRVSIDDAIKAGLRVDGSTLAYWLGESEAARREMAYSGEGGTSLVNALLSLRSFVDEYFHQDKMSGVYRTLQRVWAYGPSFDIAILDYASAVTGIELPWGHRAIRCVRTLKELYPDAERPDPKVAHKGVDDSEAQALWVQNMWKMHLATKERSDDGSSRDPEGRTGGGLRILEGEALLPGEAGHPEVDQAQDEQARPQAGAENS